MTIEEDCYLKFQALSRLSESERATELERLQREEPDVYSFVQDLLADPVENDSFFEPFEGQPSVDTSVSDTTSSSTFKTPSSLPTLNRYRLTQVLGEGGMGVVYRAWQSEPVERDVAIKIVHPGINSTQVLQRFENERKVLSRMEHANIARVFDAGRTHQGRPFFAMELIDGCSITDHCDAHQLTIEQRLALFQDVCFAVQHAHNKGIVHRDIKPSNVLVMSMDGVAIVKIIDFGVAKALAGAEDASLVTRTSQIVGTPLYMSPEQASLGGNDVDTRSDVYSLGLLLYELLTGVLPIDRNHAQKIGMVGLQKLILEEEAVRPSQRFRELKDGANAIAANRKLPENVLAQAIHHELDWIVMKAIEKEPARRYQSPGELSDEIERHLLSEPVEACPPSVSYRFKKFVARNRLATYTSMALLVGLVLATIGTSWQAYRATKAEAETAEHLLAVQAQERKTTAALNQAERNEREVRWNLYVAKLTPMMKALKEQDFPRLRKLLNETIPDKGEPDYRGWEWYYLEDQCERGSAFVGESSAEAIGKFAISESQQLLAASLSKHEIGLWDLGSHTLLKRKNIAAIASAIDFSASGEHLALGTEGGEVLIIDTSKFKITRRFSPFSSSPNPEIKDIACSSNANAGRIAFCDWHGNVGSVDRDGDGFEVHRESTSLRYGVAVDWHPTKPLLAVGLRLGERRIYDLSTGKQWELPRVSVEVGWGVEWSPSGSRIAFSEDSTIRIVRPDGSDPLTLIGHQADCVDLQWLDENRLASVGRDRSVRIWNVNEQRQISNRYLGNTVISNCRIDHTRREIYFSGEGQIHHAPLSPNKSEQSVRLTTGSEFEEISLKRKQSHHRNCITFLTWSPDDTRLAVQSEVQGPDGLFGGTAGIIDASSCRPITVWSSGLCDGPSWTPDGLVIARTFPTAKLTTEDVHSGLPIEKKSCEKIADVFAYYGNTERSRHGYVHAGKLREFVYREPTVSTANLRVKGVGEVGPLTVSWSHDDTKLVMGDYLTLIGIDTAGTLFGVWKNTTWTSSAWHPSDRFFAVGDTSGRITIGRLREFSKEIEFSGHLVAASGLDFSPCGRRLASASGDGTVRIWDVATGSELLRLSMEGVGFTYVAWSHDGQQLAAGTTTRDVVIWGTNTQRVASNNAASYSDDSADRPYVEGLPRTYHIERNLWRRWHAQLNEIAAKALSSDLTFQKDLNELTSQARTLGEKQALTTAWLAMVRGTEDPALAVRLADELLNWLPQTNDAQTVGVRIQVLLARIYRLIDSGRANDSLASLDEAQRLSELLIKLDVNLRTNWRLRIAVHFANLMALRAAIYELPAEDDAKRQILIATLRKRLDEANVLWRRIPEACFYLQDVGIQRETPWKLAVDKRILNDAIEREDWKNAILFADMQREERDHYLPSYSMTLLQAYTGDESLAIETIKEMRGTLQNKTDDASLYFICWTSILVPNSQEDFGDLIRMAESLVEREPDTRRYWEALGALRMRAGQHHQAKDIFAKSENIPLSSLESSTYLAFLRAINQWRLGNHEQARGLLNEANELAESELRASPAWNRKLTIKLFQREAKQLIGD